jgi:lysophospholipase L1-like esterase
MQYLRLQLIMRSVLLWFPFMQPLQDVPCMCSDPVKPAIPRVDPDYPRGPEDWPRAMNLNIELVNQSIASGNPLDVVFLGDSITEKWNGRSSGQFRPKDHNVSVVFQQLFQKHQNGSEVEGLALGISGDRVSARTEATPVRAASLEPNCPCMTQCQNLLYRLQHGEMPSALKPKVWWILIGTNNLGVDSCSADAITAGNIRIVQEIRRIHPNTPIVINSILPRGSEELLHSSEMWPVIQTINQRLECFARFTTESSAPVKFFNATSLFTYDDTQDEMEYGREVYVNETRMNDYLHPSAEGAVVWGREIVKMVLAMTPAGHK